MFIETEDTPNPETIKFYPGSEVAPSMLCDFGTAEEAACSPLASRIFAETEVRRVFLGRDFISVTKNSDANWESLRPKIFLAILEHYTSGEPVIRPGQKPETVNRDENLDEVSLKVIDLLEAYIRPVVAMDGGDIEFSGYKDGVVFLKMRGACAGCPGATATLKMGVERLLREQIPEVTEVQAVR